MNKPYNPADRFALRNLFPCTLSRKRGRACEDECCEFTPISKRINNLHIRSGLLKSEDDRLEEQCTNHALQCNQGNCSQAEFAMSSQIIANGSLMGPMQHGPDGCCYVPSASSAGLMDPGPSGRLSFSAAEAAAIQQHVPAHGSDSFDYNPELDASQNPHYYQINGLLYGLHLNRLQRLGKL